MVGGAVLPLSMMNPAMEPKREFIVFTNVTCDGSEPHLLSCNLSSNTLSCSQENNVGVQCHTGRNVVIGASLSGGYEVSQGQLKIFVNGRWGTVCNNRWDTRNGRTACNQMGYMRYFNYRSIMQANSFLPVLMSDIHCTGEESSLLQCQHKKLDSSGDQCSSGYVEVWCISDPSLIWFEALLPHEMFSKQVFMVSGLTGFEFDVKVCSGFKLVLMGIEMMSTPYIEIRISEFLNLDYFQSSIWKCMREDDQCSKLNSSSTTQSLLSCDSWIHIWIAIEDASVSVLTGLGKYNITSGKTVISWLSQESLDWIMNLKVGALSHEIVYKVYRGESYFDPAKHIQNTCLYTLEEANMKNSIVPCGSGYIDSRSCNQCGCCFSPHLTPQCFYPKEWQCVIELRSYSGANTGGGYMKINGRKFFPSPTQNFTGIAIGLIVPDLTAGCRFYDIKEFDDSMNVEIALSAYIAGIPAGIEFVIITGNLPVKKLENSLMLLIKDGFDISDIGANGLFAGYTIKGQPKKTQIAKSSSQTHVSISVTIKDAPYNKSCVKTFDEAVGKIALLSSGDTAEHELVTFILLAENLLSNMKTEVDFDDNSKSLLSPKKSAILPTWAASSIALFESRPFFSSTFNHSYTLVGQYEVKVMITDVKMIVNSPSVTARTSVKVGSRLPFKDRVGIVRIHTNEEAIIVGEEFVVSVFVERLTDGLVVTVDFGDGMQVENLKPVSQNLSVGIFHSPQKVANLTGVSNFFWTKANHKYTAIAARSYLVSVVVADPSWAAEPIRLTTEVIVTCEELQVNIVGGSQDSSSIPEHVRYLPITFTGNYVGWCEQNRSNIQKEWIAYKLTSAKDEPSDGVRVSIPWDALSLSGLELNIPAFSFDYGIYYLEFKVWFPVKLTTGKMFRTAHTWFKVVEKVQQMASGHFTDDSIVGINSEIQIQPNVNSSGEGDLLYKWYCTRGTEILDRDLKTGGCFGKGAEIPLGNVSSFSLNVTTLMRDYKAEDYKFYLYVFRRDEVVSIGSRELKVVGDEAPKFFINCISNCGFRITLDKDIQVSASCSNCAKQMITYQWAVIPRTALNFIELIGSDQEMVQIRFLPNAISMMGNHSVNSSDPLEAMLAKYSQVQKEYYLNVIGRLESGLEGSASLTIRLQDYLEANILMGTRMLFFSVKTLIISLMFVIIIT